MPGLAPPTSDFAKLQNLVTTFLSPPHGTAHGDELVKAIHQRVDCEAVSIFLPRKDPKRIEYISGVGYTGNYDKQKYAFADHNAFLTAWVAAYKVSINESATVLRELAKQPPSPTNPPFTGVCAFSLPSREIRNLIAVPILCHSDRGVGVLKLENYNDKSIPVFPKDDLGLAQTIASWIGIGYRQRSYAQLWHRWANRDWRTRDHDDLTAIAHFLATEIGAECASIFVLDRTVAEPVLRYKGGVGYREEYKDHAYKLDGQSFTSYVALTKQAVRMTHRELVVESEAGRIPFKGDCKSYIESGSFLDIMAIPVLGDDGNSCEAILKLENRIPSHETFDDFDIQMGVEFAQQEILKRITQVSLVPKDRDAILRKYLGPRLPRDRKPTPEQYETAIRFYLARSGEFREKEVAHWLNVAPQHLSRKIAAYQRRTTDESPEDTGT